MKLEFLLAFGTDLQKIKRLVKKVGEELSKDPNLGPALLDRSKARASGAWSRPGSSLG